MIPLAVIAVGLHLALVVGAMAQTQDLRYFLDTGM